MNNEIKNTLEKYRYYLKIIGKSEATIKTYVDCMVAFFKENSIKDLESFLSWDNKSWLKYIETTKNTIQTSTLNKRICQISSFYNFLIVSEGYTGINYCKQIPKISDDKPLYKEDITPEEDVKKLLNLKLTKIDSKHSYQSNIRDMAIIHILIRTGMRIGEVSRIRVKDIDGNRIWVRGKGKKDQISRYTDMDIETKKLVDELISFDKDREYLLITYDNKPMSVQSIRSVWYRACDACNIPHYIPHSCRHFLATKLVEKDVPLDDVKRVLGHSKKSQVAQQYYIKDNDKKDLNEITSVIDIF